jgi:D-isomer specific 2-hydroxyacid dehydrogenase, NAD binding domain
LPVKPSGPRRRPYGKAVLTFFATDSELERVRTKLPEDAPVFAPKSRPIDAEAIAAMKPTAVLVNIARGNLIEELPLYEALKAGRLAGFASEVWWYYTNSLPATYHYPIPSRTGLQRLPTGVAAGNRAG